ncbi:MAG: SAM-dependent methyltransferase [Cyclobacteriaceae bacterium]
MFLIPVVISENTHDEVIPPQIRKNLLAVRHFLAEDIRTARRFLSSLKIYQKIESLNFSVLNKDTKFEDMDGLFDPIMQGFDVGVLSESGCPGIADPGALAARFAHQHDIRVIPLVGPSSIVLSLMASGLNGQHFAFHGYLPIDGKEAGKAIRELEKASRAKNQTQIFIETPFRNNAVFSNLLKNLHGQTELCIALDITGQKEFILTKSVDNWRLKSFELPKCPAVFLFLARP